MRPSWGRSGLSMVMVVMVVVMVMMVMVVMGLLLLLLILLLLLLMLLLCCFGGSAVLTRCSATGWWASAGIGLVLCAKEVVKDVNDSGDIPFGLTIGVLEGWVQRSCKEMTYFRYKISFNCFEDYFNFCLLYFYCDLANFFIVYILSYLPGWKKQCKATAFLLFS